MRSQNEQRRVGHEGWGGCDQVAEQLKAAGLGDFSDCMHDTRLSNGMDTERAEETNSRVSLKQQMVDLFSCNYCELVFIFTF